LRRAGQREGGSGFVSDRVGDDGLACWLASAGHTYNTRVVAEHVERIAQLSPNRREAQHRVHALRIACDRRRAEVLDELAHAHQLARRAKRLLGGFKGRDAGLGPVGAVQVPCEETGEVLQRAQHFVATDWRGG